MSIVLDSYCSSSLQLTTTGTHQPTGSISNPEQPEEAVTQPEMNETAKKMYHLWDNTLNVVWKLLEEELNNADMEVLRKVRIFLTPTH